MVMTITCRQLLSGHVVRVGRRGARDARRAARGWRARHVAQDDCHLVSHRTGGSDSVSRRPRASPRPGDGIPS